MKSMTGFGKKSVVVDNYHIDIEIKAVNHRYLDIQFRMPREFACYEMAMRQYIKKKIGRGRIECVINVKYEGKDQKELKLNWHLFDQLINDLEEAKNLRYADANIHFSQILSGIVQQKDFFEIVENQKDDEKLGDYILEGLRGAVKRLNKSRRSEGKHIQKVLLNYLMDFEEHVNELKKMNSIIEKTHKNRLENKLKALVGNTIDETRILTEVALLIERGDIHEEIDRLVIHIEKMSELLLRKDAIGRELDFLIQEMNREVNTTGSKSNNIEIKNIVVQMKTILEKIREQIQNIE